MSVSIHTRLVAGVAAAIIGVALTGSIAQAREPAPTPQSDRDTVATAQSPAAKPKIYCVMVEPVTGSRIPHRVCQSRDAWMDEGFDPLAPQHK